MKSYEFEANNYVKPDNKFLMVVDVHPAEIHRGGNHDHSVHKLETEDRIFTLINTPGYKRYVKNMIAGTAMADAAVLVVTADQDFEDNFEKKNSITREYAFLAKSYGLNQVICVINKMDVNIKLDD